MLVEVLDWSPNAVSRLGFDLAPGVWTLHDHVADAGLPDAADLVDPVQFMHFSDAEGLRDVLDRILCRGGDLGNASTVHLTSNQYFLPFLAGPGARSRNREGEKRIAVRT